MKFKKNILSLASAITIGIMFSNGCSQTPTPAPTPKPSTSTKNEAEAVLIKIVSLTPAAVKNSLSTMARSKSILTDARVFYNKISTIKLPGVTGDKLETLKESDITAKSNPDSKDANGNTVKNLVFDVKTSMGTGIITFLIVVSNTDKFISVTQKLIISDKFALISGTQDIKSVEDGTNKVTTSLQVKLKAVTQTPTANSKIIDISENEIVVTNEEDETIDKDNASLGANGNIKLFFLKEIKAIAYKSTVDSTGKSKLAIDDPSIGNVEVEELEGKITQKVNGKEEVSDGNDYDNVNIEDYFSQVKGNGNNNTGSLPTNNGGIPQAQK